MNKFVLISVCEREIVTEQFDKFEDAFLQMIIEVKEEFLRINGDINEWEALEVASKVSEDGYYEDEGYGFFVFKDSAWSNIDEDWKTDWRIIEVK